MTREEIRAYTLRVTEANSCDLIVILYDVVIGDIDAAKQTFDACRTDDFVKHIHHATRFMNELISNLNFSVPLSYDLMSLYSYSLKRLSYAAASKKPDALDIVREIMEKLRAGFSSLAEADTSGPIMKNTQSVYAGLTYGRGCLNETFVDPRDYNRGFKA